MGSFHFQWCIRRPALRWAGTGKSVKAGGSSGGAPVLSAGSMGRGAGEQAARMRSRQGVECTPDEPEPQAEPEQEPQPEVEQQDDARSAIWRKLQSHDGQTEALAGAWGSFSFDLLRRMMVELARALQSSPSTPSCIGLLCDEGPLIPVTELAVAALLPVGTRFVPLDPTLPVERIRFLMKNAGVDAVVTNTQYWHAVAVSGLSDKVDRPLAAVVMNFKAGAFCVDHTVTCLGRHTQQCTTEGRTDVASEEVEVHVHADPLYLIYTSGTSGQPKGVVGSVRELMVYISRSECLRRGPGDRVLLCSAVTWDPSISDIFGTLVGPTEMGGSAMATGGGGATLVLEHRARLMSRLDLCIEDWSVTHVLATPALWRMLFAATPTASTNHKNTIDSAEGSTVSPVDESLRLCSLRCLQLGGERWAPQDLFLPKGLRMLQNIYGVTECVVYQAITSNMLTASATSSGRSPPALEPVWLRAMHPGVELRVAHPQAAQEETTGGGSSDSLTRVEGELLIGGEQVLTYHEETRASVKESIEHDTSLASGGALRSLKFAVGTDGRRWFRTGDRVVAQLLPVRSLGAPVEGCQAGGNTGCPLGLLSVPVEQFLVVGRLDRQVKINGFRIELDAIENVLSQAPALSMHAGKVVCHFVPERQRLLAYVDRRPLMDQQALGAEQGGRLLGFPELSVALRAFCESQLPRWEVPHRFIAACIPLTSSGKIDRQQVITSGLLVDRQPADERGDEQRVEREPSLTEHDALDTPTERMLGAIWTELFSDVHAEVTSRSHFFELGGTSIMAVQMVTRLPHHFSSMQDDPMARHRRLCGLINRPRLREFAQFLDGEKQQQQEEDHGAVVSDAALDSVESSGPAIADDPAPPAVEWKTPKMRRKRRNLRAGLPRHTTRMLAKHISLPPGQTDYGMADVVDLDESRDSGALETTELAVLKLAETIGDVYAAETLRLALKGRAGV